MMQLGNSMLLRCADAWSQWQALRSCKTMADYSFTVRMVEFVGFGSEYAFGFVAYG